ncbi:MAG: tetratricopeptide repeat protein [Geitlerinemataceae cyanobacterium]|mgnify:CR=1 FL=1
MKPSLKLLLSAAGLAAALAAPAPAQDALDFSPTPPAEVAPSGAVDPALQSVEIERVEIERIIEREVDESVSRNFGVTIRLLNTLLIFLIASPFLVVLLVWLFRSSAIAQLVDEVERRFGDDLRDELQQELRAELQTELQAELRAQLQAANLQTANLQTANLPTNPQAELQREYLPATHSPESDRPSAPDFDRAPTSAPPQPVSDFVSSNPPNPTGHTDEPPSPEPPTSTEDEQRLKEMVSMALSARQTLTDAHKTLDDLLDYHLDRAKQLEREERYTEALTAYDKAIEIEPSAPLPHCARGALFVRLQRFDEAIAAFDRALEVQPDCPEARYGKACCFASVGYDDRAIEELRAALVSRPELRVVAQSDALLASLRDREWFQTEVVG